MTEVEVLTGKVDKLKAKLELDKSAWERMRVTLQKDCDGLREQLEHMTAENAELKQQQSLNGRGPDDGGLHQAEITSLKARIADLESQHAGQLSMMQVELDESRRALSSSRRESSKRFLVLSSLFSKWEEQDASGKEPSLDAAESRLIVKKVGEILQTLTHPEAVTGEIPLSENLDTPAGKKESTRLRIESSGPRIESSRTSAAKAPHTANVEISSPVCEAAPPIGEAANTYVSNESSPTSKHIASLPGQEISMSDSWQAGEHEETHLGKESPLWTGKSLEPINRHGRGQINKLHGPETLTSVPMHAPKLPLRQTNTSSTNENAPQQEFPSTATAFSRPSLEFFKPRATKLESDSQRKLADGVTMSNIESPRSSEAIKSARNQSVANRGAEPTREFSKPRYPEDDVPEVKKAPNPITKRSGSSDSGSGDAASNASELSESDWIQPIKPRMPVKQKVEKRPGKFSRPTNLDDEPSVREMDEIVARRLEAAKTEAVKVAEVAKSVAVETNTTNAKRRLSDSATAEDGPQKRHKRD